MRKTIAALIGAAATATMITGAGAASAATGHRASTHPASTRTEHFQSVSGSLTSSSSPVAAYGAFNASGTDVQTGNTTDTFTFPGGSFRVTHKVTRSHQHFSKRTCAGTARQSGTYKISRGTGKYAGITGHGRVKVRVLLVFRHTAHGCSQKPVASQAVIRAHGTVTLP
jgi:hypothetical protein